MANLLPQIWKQANNPVTSGVVSGYEAVSVPYTGCCSGQAIEPGTCKTTDRATATDASALNVPGSLRVDQTGLDSS